MRRPAAARARAPRRRIAAMTRAEGAIAVGAQSHSSSKASLALTRAAARTLRKDAARSLACHAAARLAAGVGSRASARAAGDARSRAAHRPRAATPRVPSAASPTADAPNQAPSAYHRCSRLAASPAASVCTVWSRARLRVPTAPRDAAATRDERRRRLPSRSTRPPCAHGSEAAAPSSGSFSMESSRPSASSPTRSVRRASTRSRRSSGSASRA